jgi:adenosine deaminase
MIPKVELHLHLDCSLSYNAVAQLDRSISRTQYDSEFVAPPVCASLADFLTRAPRGFQLMQTEDALRLAVVDLFEQLAADGVIYAEIRFAPLLHRLRGLSSEQVVRVVDRVTEECIRSTSVEARIILCTLRHFTAAQSMETAQLAANFAGSRVTALDIAGDEAGHPLDPHIAAFQCARELGLCRTAHAGEAAGAASVWQSLRELDPSRIGHGVRSVEDAALIEHLRGKQIHLEICPASNVQTRAVASYREHPIAQLRQAGVSLGISTDARTITNTTLEQEYARLSKHFGWSGEHFHACNRSALQAAFVDEPTRARLMAKLDAVQARVR